MKWNKFFFSSSSNTNRLIKFSCDMDLCRMRRQKRMILICTESYLWVFVTVSRLLLIFALACLSWISSCLSIISRSWFHKVSLLLSGVGVLTQLLFFTALSSVIRGTAPHCSVKYIPHMQIWSNCKCMGLPPAGCYFQRKIRAVPFDSG